MCKNRTRKFCFSSFFVPAKGPPTALFGALLPTTLTAPFRTFATISRDPFVRCAVQFPWGSWKLFELSGSRLSPNCGSSWTKWDTRFGSRVGWKASTFWHVRHRGNVNRRNAYPFCTAALRPIAAVATTTRNSGKLTSWAIALATFTSASSASTVGLYRSGFADRRVLLDQAPHAPSARLVLRNNARGQAERRSSARALASR